MKSVKDNAITTNVSPSASNHRAVRRKIESIASVLWMEVNTEECSFKPRPILSSLTLTWFSALQPSSRNCKCRETWRNHYSYEKVVYLPDSRWLITVEAVSMATSSFAAKGKWDFHPISFEMALVFSERGELDLLEQEFCCKTQNSESPNTFFIPL